MELPFLWFNLQVLKYVSEILNILFLETKVPFSFKQMQEKHGDSD